MVAVLTSLGMVIIWFAAFETLWRGRTLGKAAMGLRVVGVDGTTVRFQQAFLRAAVGLVDFFLIPIGFVAVVSVLLSPRDQRLGDMAAGTLVVRERVGEPDVAPAWFRPPSGWERYAASLDVAALDEDAYYGWCANYLLRAPSWPAAPATTWRCASPTRWRCASGTPRRRTCTRTFLVCVAARGEPTTPGAHGVPVPADRRRPAGRRARRVPWTAPPPGAAALPCAGPGARAGARPPAPPPPPEASSRRPASPDR